jgi:hypothetical protein
MATPIGKVSAIQKIQMSAVKSNGRLMATNASRHSLRMKTNQATPRQGCKPPPKALRQRSHASN